MKIKASTVEGHRFGTVRKNGYDPGEVEAVMDRLVSTLQTHERVTGELSERVSAADESAEAVRRTYQAAQQTKREMIAEGHAEADELVREARTKAGDVLAAAATEAERDRAEAAATLADASENAASRTEEAEAEVAAIRATVEGLTEDAEVRAERLLEETRGEAHAIVLGASTEADELLANTRADAERVEQSADAMATELLIDARRRAEELLDGARAEEAELRGHLVRLDNAVSDVEDRIQSMSRAALGRTTSIREAIELAADEGPNAGPSEDTIPPENGRLALQTEDLIAQNGSGRS